MLWQTLTGAGTLLTGIGALAAWKQSKAVHTEVRTNHGVRAGDRIERMSDQMDRMMDLLVDHITDRQSHN